MAGAKYFPPAVRGTFSPPKTGPTRFPSDGKSLARCKPPSENDEMEFSFSKRLFLSFFSFCLLFFLSSLSFRTIKRTASTRGGAPADAHCVSPPPLQHATRGLSRPSNGLCLSDHRVYSARGTIKRSRTKRYEVEIRRRARRGEARRQLPSASCISCLSKRPTSRWREGGLFPLTRKIVGNCWREGRKEKSTFRQPLSIAHLSSKFLFSLSSDSLSLSLVSTTLSGQSLSGKCGKLERKWIPPHNREESYNSRLGKRGRGL